MICNIKDYTSFFITYNWMVEPFQGNSQQVECIALAESFQNLLAST